MSVGPLRRATAAIGLMAMIPIAALVVAGSLSPEEAAVRAVAVALAVVLVGNVARSVLTRMLRRVERRTSPEQDPAADGLGVGPAEAA